MISQEAAKKHPDFAGAPMMRGRAANTGSFGFQGVLALQNPPDYESDQKLIALRADSQSAQNLTPRNPIEPKHFLPSFQGLPSVRFSHSQTKRRSDFHRSALCRLSSESVSCAYGFHTVQTLPTRSGPGVRVVSPGVQPEGVTSPVSTTCWKAWI